MEILRLAAQGKLGLADDARKHLPELAVHDKARPITIQDMLLMRSGLTSYMSGIEKYEDLVGWTNERVLKEVADAELDFATGSKFEYSNTDYSLLALIAKRASGKAFSACLASDVFGPLGMKSSLALDSKDQEVPNRVTGYAVEDGKAEPRQIDTTLCGDGNVFASIDDMIRWDQGLRDGTLLPMEEYERTLAEDSEDTGEGYRYGFGWCVYEVGGHTYTEHGGSWEGTSTFIARYLDEDVTVIVLMNDQNGSARWYGRKICAMILGDDAVPND